MNWSSFRMLVASITLFLASVQAMADQHGILRVGAVSLRPFGEANISDAFLTRLAELGYEQGRNFDFKFIQAPNGGAYEAAYRDLVASGVDILAAGGPEAALKGAVAAANGKIPIVMIASDYDPLALAYVASLAEPGGNVTGVFFRQVALTEKRLEIMREAFLPEGGVTIFWDRNSADQWERAQGAAATLGIPVFGVELRDRPYDYDIAIERAPPEYRGGLMVLASPLFSLPSREHLTEFALRRQLPTIYHVRFFPDVGGLMSYGVSFTKLFRRAADFVDKIAKGANPSTLPVEQPAQYELVVNLRTAAALNFEFPESILLRADEVIE